MNNFAIWTVQRTGSTTLVDIIEKLTSKEILHEPFNEDRKFSFRRNLNILDQHLKQLKEKEFLFKHCWNVHSNECNSMLLDFLLREGYKVILLKRRNLLAMEVSRQLAKQTDIWGKQYPKGIGTFEYGTLSPFNLDEMRKKINQYEDSLSFYKDWFHQNEIPSLSIAYEDIFTGSLAERFNHVRTVLDFLSIPIDLLAEKSDDITNLLLNYKLNDAETYSKIPNLVEIIRSFPEYTLVENAQLEQIRN